MCPLAVFDVSADGPERFDGAMTTEPLRPTALETVLFEPDQRAVIAVLPGGLWLTAGDIVELDDPPRDARVLSTRLQVGRNGARVLIVLDVPDDPDDALRGETPTEVVLGADIDDLLPVGAELDEELEQLTGEGLAPTPPEQTVVPTTRVAEVETTGFGTYRCQRSTPLLSTTAGSSHVISQWRV